MCTRTTGAPLSTSTQTGTRSMSASAPSARHDLSVVAPVCTTPTTLTGVQLLGRAPGAGGIPVPDPTVSSRHCLIRPARGGDAYVVEDHQSKNGTWLNGVRCEGPQLLESQGVIRLGDALLIYDPWCWPEPPPIAQAGRALGRARAEVQIDRLAARNHHVIIEGPTGAGKERLAQRLGHQRGGPFEAINCAVLSSDLAASTLFGHVRGAFTGASSAQPGLFQRCDGGTLFLDEVAELDLQTQAMLLRALEGDVRPVGGSRSERVHVRVVAATHCRLDDAVLAGRFREDLYARLSTFVVQLPGLAERRADILPIFHSLATQHGPLGHSPLTPPS